MPSDEWDHYLDAVPFRMYLIRQRREFSDTKAMATAIGVGEQQLRRWLQGYEWINGVGCEPSPIRSVRVRSVDKVGIALGDPGLLNRLYPWKQKDQRRRS